MNTYECYNCNEVMEIKSIEDVDHCPCCGCPDTIMSTEKKVPDEATLAEDWEHDGSEGCGAIYSVLSEAPAEYCPNCNGQNG